jgi:hypothetical protein
MITEQIESMEAGPEMDMAVAEACRESATIYFDHDAQENICLRLPGDVRFRPSTDYNDAMFAAEQFGRGFHMSDYGRSHVANPDRQNKFVVEIVSESGVTYTAFAPTGPLAICRAILKLHAGGAR